MSRIQRDLSYQSILTPVRVEEELHLQNMEAVIPTNTVVLQGISHGTQFMEVILETEEAGVERTGGMEVLLQGEINILVLEGQEVEEALMEDLEVVLS